MKVPAWVYLIGISMILFGGCGTLSNLYTSPTLSSEYEKNFSKEEKEIMDMFGLDNLEISVDDIATQNLYKKIGIPISILYFLSGLLLVLKNKNALKISYFTLILSIVFTVVKFFVYTASDSSLVNISGYSLWLLVLVDLILFIILVSVDKTQWNYVTGEYEAPEQNPEHHNYST